MHAESILCEFGRICTTVNALTLLESILCKFGQICATGNAPKHPMQTNCWQELYFEFSRQNHPLDIKNIPWNIMEAHGTKPKGARLEKKADISAQGPSPDLRPEPGMFQTTPDNPHPSVTPWVAPESRFLVPLFPYKLDYSPSHFQPQKVIPSFGIRKSFIQNHFMTKIYNKQNCSFICLYKYTSRVECFPSDPARLTWAID